MVPKKSMGKTVLFHRTVGNRFHVLFLNCGLLYCFADTIVDFFATSYKPRNAVQIAVNNALLIPELRVPLRAMGIMGKLLTGPWMRLPELQGNILDLNPVFSEAYTSLQAWSQDASPLLLARPPCAFTSSDIVERDSILQALTTSTVNDASTEQLLQEFSKAALDVFDRQLKKQLPGGEFWNPSTQLREESASCSATNISGERVFAMSDYEMLRARGAKVSFVESKVMYKANKTQEWLRSLPKKTRAEHVIEARKKAREIRQADVEQCQNVDQQIEENLKTSRQELLQKDEKERDNSEKLVEEVYHSGGLWQNDKDIEDNVKNLRKGAAVKAVKAQINVRVKLLKCKADEKIALSRATLAELKQHLLVLMSRVPEEMKDMEQLFLVPESLIGHRFLHRFNVDGKLTWHEGSIVDRTEDTQEFCLSYDGENSPCFFTSEEMIVDVIRGDLDLLCKE